MSVDLLYIDNMNYMAGLPDKAFQLAIVDPPYGLGEAHQGMISRHHSQKKYAVKDWDNSPPQWNIFKNYSG